VRTLPPSGEKSSDSDVVSLIELPANSLKTLIGLAKGTRGAVFYKEDGKVYFECKNMTMTSLVRVCVAESQMNGQSVFIDSEWFESLNDIPLERVYQDVVIKCHKDGLMKATAWSSNILYEKEGVWADEGQSLKLKKLLPTHSFNLDLNGVINALLSTNGKTRIDATVNEKSLNMRFENNHGNMSLRVGGSGPKEEFVFAFNKDILLEELKKAMGAITGGTIRVGPKGIIQFDMYVDKMPTTLFLAPMEIVPDEPQ